MFSLCIFPEYGFYGYHVHYVHWVDARSEQDIPVCGNCLRTLSSHFENPERVWSANEKWKTIRQVRILPKKYKIINILNMRWSELSFLVVYLLYLYFPLNILSSITGQSWQFLWPHHLTLDGKEKLSNNWKKIRIFNFHFLINSVLFVET